LTKDLNLKLKLGVKDEGTKQSLDNVISLLKKLEQAGKEGGKGTAVGAKQAAEAIRVLKLETQQNKVATEAGKREQIELKNALIKAKLAAQEERQEFQKLKNQLNETNKSAETLKKTFGLLGTVISVGLVVKTFKDISTAAIEAAESENLFVVSLGNHVKAARQWSEELSKTLGLNAYEVRKNVGTFNVMLNSMGLAEDQAYDMGKVMTKLSYDLASFYNLSHEEAFNKIRSGITGEAEPLKALGIILNETTVKQAAYTHGIAKQGKELTEVQKIQARYIALMEQTQKAQGDLERTSDSVSNQMKRMESTVKDLYITTGNLLIPTIQDLIKTFLEFISALKEFVEKHGVQIQTTFEAIAQTITNTIDTIVSAVNALNNVTFGGFETAFNGVLSALNTASYIAAKLAKEIELLTAITKQSEGIPTENELYQKKLAQMGINPDAIPLEAQVNPNHPLYAKLQQAYALAKSEHVQLKYGDQNPHTREIDRLKQEIGELEKTWLETQKKLLIKPYQLNEELKKQNSQLEEKLKDVNIGDGMVMPTTGTISSPYGKRKDPFTGEMKDHTGIDIANKLGTKIKAAAGGKIIHAGKLGGYGQAIIIEHGDGLQTLYGHLNKILVKDKQQVFQGDTIAEMGSTGRSTGSHLHFEVKEKGKPVNPTTYISSLTPSKKEFLEEETSKAKKHTIDKQLETAVYRLDKMKELLAKAETLGISQTGLQFGTQHLNIDRLKAIGLSDQDIDLIQSQATQMYDGLMKADESYQQFKNKQLDKARLYYETYTKQLAEAQINYELKLKDIESSEKPEELKNVDKTNLQKVHDDTVSRLKTEYAEKIKQLNKEILEEDIKNSEKRIEIVEAEVKKQIDLREEAHEKTQELEKATVRIYQDAANQKSLFEAQRSGDTLAILNAEAKIKADAIQREIEDIRRAADQQITELIRVIEAEETLASTRTELEKEKQAVIENSLAQIDVLRQKAHQNELDRIKKETDAYAEQFEKRLGFMAKIFGMAGKIMGGDNILSKISGYIGSYGSTVTDVLKQIGVFTKQSGQNQQSDTCRHPTNSITKCKSGITITGR
jgi:murein DD-endopeptidase MepM/ murein hydrolase activator NlpD